MGASCVHDWDWRGWADTPLTNCTRPKRYVCIRCGETMIGRCGSSSVASCEPCGVSYRRRVRRIATSGLVDVGPDRWVMLTFTAPGDREHHRRDGQLCSCTPAEGVDLATWNGRAVDRWNDLARSLERALGEYAYFRAVEVQKRGALHLHVLVRFDRRTVVRVQTIRELAMRHGFGHSVDVARSNAEGAAGYCAKYVSKSAGDRNSVPFVHRVTGEVGPGRWRTWTASRDWGTTMGQIRAAQALWAALAGGEAEPGAAGAPLASASAAGVLIPEAPVTQGVPTERVDQTPVTIG